METKIAKYEKESQIFDPFKHFKSRIEEMEKRSIYGAEIAVDWEKILNQFLIKETYPVVHPIGEETFSLYAKFPTGVFEYALHIDGATTLIKENSLSPVKFSSVDIIDSVDQGNINKDLGKIKYNHKNPPMVIESLYLTDNKPYCINGNHRINESYRNNDEQIEVYVFKDLEFMPFFYDELSRAMYLLEIDYKNVISDEQHLMAEWRKDFAKGNFHR